MISEKKFEILKKEIKKKKRGTCTYRNYNEDRMN